jgi:hypothetical protein
MILPESGQNHQFSISGIRLYAWLTIIQVLPELVTYQAGKYDR